MTQRLYVFDINAGLNSGINICLVSYVLHLDIVKYLPVSNLLSYQELMNTFVLYNLECLH